MSLGEQIAFGYGVLSVLATAFLLLMAYWQYKRPVDKVAAEVIFFRYIDDNYQWYVQLTDGKEFGPFSSEANAKDHRNWFNRKR